MGKIDNLTSSQILYLLRIQGPESPYFRRGKTRNFGGLFGLIAFNSMSVGFLIEDPNFRKILLILIISIMGIFKEMYFCYGILLIDFIVSHERSLVEFGFKIFLPNRQDLKL